MTYHLGVDLGTTYTAAAVHEAGRVEVVPLGERGPAVPSVIYLGQDGDVVAGDAANRHAVTDVSRVAREFKRRLGDPTPVVLGGVTMPAEALTGHLLRWVYESVARARGNPPATVALSHPANWGTYKRDLLASAAAGAGLPGVTLVTEPQAAAIHYASQERVSPGAVVAVYDLGGGTFDVAVLRKETDGGFTVLGSPEGIERLGGIDFDEAVFAHVTRSLGEVFEQLDPDDGATVAAVARLRQECIQAKEALSVDTEATIPVLLPTVQTEVRTTRAELEDMIRPSLNETLTALGRALRSAGLGAGDVDRVLLVGGSSRVPLVGQLVSGQVGRPVAVDTHPKHAVALGGAITAARAAGEMVGDAAAGPQPGAGVPAAAAPGPPTGPPGAPPPPGPPTGPPGAPPPPGAAPTGQGPGDPTFDAAGSEMPAPSLGYQAASSPPPPGPPPGAQPPAPPPPGGAAELPPGFTSDEQKAARRRRSRRRARIGAVIGALVILVALAATFLISVISQDTLELADVEEGECFAGQVDDLEVVDCGEPHNGEVVAVTGPPDDQGDEFPGQEELQATMDQVCFDEVTELFGAGSGAMESRNLRSFAYVPTEEAWNEGSRQVRCVAALENLGTMRGSVEGRGTEEG